MTPVSGFPFRAAESGNRKLPGAREALHMAPICNVRRMDIGVIIFPTDTTIDPITLARAVEERGFESLWFPEHSHIPTDRTTPWGGRIDADPLPEWYWRTHDQLLALMAAAAVTDRIRLGTGITLVAQHDPIWLAKRVATLDVLSDGRVEFGIGYGWNREEMAHHGVRYADRRAMVREKVLAMKELWTNDEAEFHGEFVDFSSSWSWPKPVQDPHPPITLGSGAGPKSFAHVAEFCDGWIPIAGRHPIEQNIERMRTAVIEAGRDPDDIALSIFYARPKELDHYRQLGVRRAILGLPQGTADDVMVKLDEYAGLL